MDLKGDQEKVCSMLRDPVSLMCKSGLHYQLEISIEGLIGVTIDKKEVFLVSIKDLIQDGPLHVEQSMQQSDRCRTADKPSSRKVRKKVGKRRRVASGDSGSESYSAVPSVQEGLAESDLESDTFGPPPAKLRPSNHGNSGDYSAEEIKYNFSEGYTHSPFTVSKAEADQSGDDIVIVKEEMDDSFLGDQTNMSGSYTDSGQGQSHFDSHGGLVPVSMTANSSDTWHIQPGTSAGPGMTALPKVNDPV